MMVTLRGDEIPVSAFPVGGETPMGLSNNEKRTIAEEVPEVDMDKCTQCNYCSYVCPHAVIRPFILDQQQVDEAPATLETRKATASEMAGYHFRIQVSAGDCTGCEVCVKTCPDDALRMVLANATGCSSIWGNPYGSAPYTKRDKDGKGP